MERDLLDFFSHLAKESEAVIRSYFRTRCPVELKDDLSPVTAADKETEERIRSAIERNFPEHGIYGEELGRKEATSEYGWWIDPIDGTRSFVAGVPLFGTLVALVKEEEPIWGMINLPMLNTCLIGNNERAWCNREVVQVSNTSSLNQATLVVSDHFSIGEYHNQKRFDRLAREVWLYRTWGDCYGYHLVATGYADIMVDPVMSRWDSMALIPVIRGAGGSISDYHGRDATKHWDSIVATNGRLHQEVIRLLRS